MDLRGLRKFVAVLAALALMCAPIVPAAAAQQATGSMEPYSLWGQIWASAFGQWSVPVLNVPPTVGPGTVTLSLSTAAPPVLPNGTQFQPLATNAPLLIDTGANQETATPSAVNCSWGSGICQITITLAKAHPAAFSVQSGTAGLQEAIDYAKQAGGTVTVNPGWAGTTGDITGANGFDNVEILDQRTGQWTWYGWTDSAYEAVLAVNMTPPGVSAIFTNVAAPIIGGTYYSDQYTGGLPALIAELGSTPATVICPADGSTALAAALAIPSNITFDAQQGCISTLGNFNLYDNGPVTSGPWQIFNQNGTGRVFFGYNGSGPVATVQSFDYPEWWGAKPDGTTNSLPAMESAIRAWPVGSSIGGGGSVILQTASASNAAYDSRLGYYLQGGNLLIDHSDDIGAKQNDSAFSNRNGGPYLITDPGYGVMTAFDLPTSTGSDGGGVNGAHLHDFGVTVNASTGWSWIAATVAQGSNQVTVSNGAIFGVNDLVTTQAPGLPYPAGTYVTAVNGNTLTLSQNAAVPITNVDVYPLFRIPAALQQTATASTGSCTYTGVSNVNALVPGEEIEGYIGATLIPLYSYIAGINYSAATIDVWGGGNHYVNLDCNAPASGTATFWPVAPAVGLFTPGGIDRVAVQYFGGNGFDLHGNESETPQITFANYDWLKDSSAEELSGNGVDIQGSDANSVMVSGTGSGSFGYLGLNGVHNTGLSNHFYALGFESSGLSDILEPYTANSDIWGWYSDDGGGAVPSQCGGGTVIEAGHGYTYSCAGGIQQNGWQHSWSNYDGVPEQWNNAAGAYTATATVGSTCLASVANASDWWIGESIYSTSTNVLPGGTTVTAVGSCSGSNSLTLSQAVLSGYGESRPAGLSFTIDIAPDYAIGINGGEPGDSFGLCSTSLLALGSSSPNFCLVWQWHAGTGETQAGAPDYFVLGSGTNKQVGLSVSSGLSADGRVPFVYAGGLAYQTFGSFLFGKPLYLGCEFTGSCGDNNLPAMGADPLNNNGAWPAGSVNGNEYANPGDIIWNANANFYSGYTTNEGVAAWQALKGGKNAEFEGTFTAGSDSVTVSDANYTIAPGDILTAQSPPYIAPDTWVTAVTGSGFTMSSPATGSGTEYAYAQRYGKVHTSSDTISVTNGSTNATLSGSDWSQYDTINCVDCAAGTYIASINGSSVVLSQDATGTGTVSAGGVDGEGLASLAQIPEGPGGVQVSPAEVIDCGTSASCASPTAESTPAIMVVEHPAFSSSTTLSLSGLPFSGTNTYTCTANDTASAHNYTATYLPSSGSAGTLTASTSNSDTWNVTCQGH